MKTKDSAYHSLVFSVWPPFPMACFITMVLLLIFSGSRAQEIDQITEARLGEEDLYLTALDELTEEATQSDDVSAELVWLHHQPLTLDLKGFDLLGEMGILDAFKINKLKEHVYKYGPMLSIYEIRYVKALTREEISIVESVYARSRHQDGSPQPAEDVAMTSNPTISPGTLPTTERLRWKPIRQTFTFRYGRKMEMSPAYASRDTLSASGYAGSPGQVALKYDLTVGSRLTIGFRAEKDAGEVLSLRKVNYGDAVILPGLDHYSGFIKWNGTGFLRQFLIGDFQLRFGQGLNLWNGYGMSRPFEPAGVLRTAVNLKPNTGLAPFSFFRGAAVEMVYRKCSATLFFSSRKLDASLEPLPGDSTILIAVSIRNTGYHRTINELSQRKNLPEMVYGGRISFSQGFLKTGVTIYRQQFGSTVDLSGPSYKMFLFSGKSNLVMGSDIMMVFRRVMLFAEVSVNAGRGLAWMAGAAFTPVPDLKVALMTHQQSAGYINFHQNHYSSTPPGIPSRSIYAGLQWSPFPQFHIKGFADHTDYQWIRYSSRGLSSKLSCGIELITTLSKKFTLRAGYRSGRRQINTKPPYQKLYELGMTGTRSLDFRIHIHPSQRLELRCLAEMTLFKGELGNHNYGTMVAQEIIYSHGSWFHSLFVRTVLFDTENFDARIYSYERDVYGSASIPAYYDHGTRLVIMARFDLFNAVSLWLRYGLYHYPDKQAIGSGANEILGNIKSDIKFQLRIKF